MIARLEIEVERRDVLRVKSNFGSAQ